jgi:hypothetical protein
MTVLLWPEIEGFQHVRKFVLNAPEELTKVRPDLYRAKVKLHGTNSAIKCHSNGTVVAQSRTTELTLENDNAGFARWVKNNENFWNLKNDLVIYGEWVGPNVQKGVAVSQIPRKSFAVFAARSLLDSEVLIFEPSELEKIVTGIPDTYVLPWVEPHLFFNWNSSEEVLKPVVDTINTHVTDIENCDPWVEKNFGIKGTGEGLVFYPINPEVKNQSQFFEYFAFKAKGEKHRVVKSSGAAQVNISTAAGAEEFANLVLTTARLEQGCGAVNNGSLEHDKRLTGKFVTWVLGDVQKETTEELKASGLSWSDVQKTIADRARSWYLKNQ